MEKNSKIDDFIYDMKLKARDIGDWCQRHRETLIVLIPVFVSGSIELIKIAAKNKNTGEERRLKENFIYDRSQGHYYELRRKPTANEWRMIDHRKDSGEFLGDILDGMSLLK